jgi:hypothetical protein
MRAAAKHNNTSIAVDHRYGIRSYREHATIDANLIARVHNAKRLRGLTQELIGYKHFNYTLFEK